tara:strand:- start:284 stop:1423 length:1140 start_codon:yes stop_codon:yes gene_type:complete
MKFELTQEQKMIKDMTQKFASEELAPESVKRDVEKIWPHKQIKKMSELGLMGMMVDSKWGGTNMDTISYVVAMEEIAKVDASAAVIMSVNNSLVCYIFQKYANDRQKKKYLVPLCRGERLGCFSLSEPQSGSDASNMNVYAKKEGDNFIISGTKNWVTNGIQSDVIMLFCVTEKNIGHKGISCFIIDKDTPGVSVGKAEEKLGIRSSDTCELYFDQVSVSKDNLVGELGDGFKIALSTLDGGRIGIAAQALGIAQASLENSIYYSKERKQFGKPISANQSIQFKLADMAMQIEAARLLTYKAAWKKDSNMNFGVSASMAKVFASEVAMQSSNQCVQIHGGYGYIKETGVERLMRDAKITQIYEGTSEIQRVVIARDLLK